MKKINLGLVILLLVLGACARSVPGQPQDVKVEKRSTGLLITWKDSSSGELEEDKFIIQRAVGTEDFKNLVEILKNTSTTNVLLSYEDKSADLTKVNRYRVGAVIGGKSPIFSKEVKFDPNAQSGEKVTLRVIREGTGNGFITSSPAGINCNHNTGTGCSAQFTKGTKVTLTTTPNTGSSFVGYSDNCNETGALTCDIVMDGNKEVTENMVSAGPGLNIVLAGDSDSGVVVDLNTTPRYEYINCGLDCNEPLPVGTIVVLEARPNEGITFAGWENCPEIEGTTGNRCRVTVATVTVIEATFLNPTSKPTIDTFTATPDKFATGQSGDVTLAWEISTPTSSAVTDISISDGTNEVCTTDTLDLEDSCVVASVAASTTFTLTVESAFGPETATATVTVGDAAVITKFEVVDKSGSEIKIAKGDTVTLSWGVAGAEPLTITLSNDQSSTPETVTADGSKDVTPDETTIYTLTADNEFGASTTQSITITVGDKPVIDKFEADTSIVLVGGVATLSWEVTPDDAELTIEPDVGTVTGDSKELSFPAGGIFTYTLTAKNEFGSTESEPVTIRVGRAPTITSFTTSKEAIPTDGSVPATLDWTVSGIQPITLIINQGVGNVTELESVDVTPDSTLTYTLTATNDFGTDSETVTVEVGDPPVISNFLATPNPVPSTDLKTILSWSRDIPANGPITKITIDPGAIDVPVGDSSVEVTVPDSGETYTLKIENKFGFDTETVTVDVSTSAPPEPPVIESFSVSPTSVPENTDTLVTFTWEITRQDTLTELKLKPEPLDDPIFMDPATSTFSYTTTVNISRDKKFTLSAKNDNIPPPRKDTMEITLRVDD